MTLLACSLTACSSFYYFPVKEEFVDRTKMPQKPEDIYFDSEDGTHLHGWYFKSQSKEKSKGVILFFHGNAQNLTTHFYTLYTAPARGYDYFIFDYRGYGHSDGSPNPKGVVADGRAAMRWLKRNHPDLPLIVFGQSLGGAIALRTVIDMKGEIPVNLTVVDSTFGSYRSAARTVLSKSWITWLFQPIGWLIVDNSQAPMGDMGKMTPTHLVVIHGDKDQVVNYSLGQDLFKAASEPKEFWTIPNGRHTDFMWREDGLYAKRFYDLLDSYTEARQR